MPATDPMRKRVKTDSTSDGPSTQTMTRFSSTRGTSPTQQRTSPSSFTFSPSSPPSPLSLARKPLTIDPELSTSTATGFSPSSISKSSYFASDSSSSSSSSASASASASVRSLFQRLSTKRDNRQWLASTPKGADALRFRHFCPICYRHHSSILVTSCCQHNICGECATSYLATKLPNYLPLAFLPVQSMPCACPNCNQNSGVRFVRVTDTRDVRSYVESPRTTALMRQQQQAELDEQRQSEGVAQLQAESQKLQLSQQVMA